MGTCRARWVDGLQVLLINQFFWPDGAATSHLLTDFANHLAAQGHQVTVICGPSDYAPAKGRPRPAVSIYRAPALPFSRQRLSRILSYASFYVAAGVYSLRVPRPDVVVTLTTPPLLELLGTMLAKGRECRHYIWAMDLYPEIAVDAGVLGRDSWITRITGRLARYSRTQADGVIALGGCMRDRLVAQGVPADSIRVAETWADSSVIWPRAFPAEGRLMVMYSGNLGLVHDAETILGAMRKLKQDSRFGFLFAGFGARRPAFEQACRADGLRAEFLPFQDLDELGATLAQGHVGLVTQDEACLGAMVPSKMYGVMAAGRPILFIGPQTATAARLIARFDCGWHVAVGDVDGLVHLLQLLAADPERVRAAGARAHQAFLKHFDREVGQQRVEAALQLRATAETVELGHGG